MDVRVVDLLPEQIENVYPGEENVVRREWVGRMMKKGLRRKLAYDAKGTRVGWLEYMPVEEALDCVDGENVNVIHCLIDGIDYRGGSDVAQALLRSVEQESAASGRGVAVALHKFKDIFLERGYEVIAKHPYGPLGELFLKTSGPNQRVWFLEGEKPDVELVEGKVVVDLYWNTWCSDCAYGLGENGLEAVRQACSELGESVLLREHELDRTAIRKFATGHNLILINGVDVTPFAGLTSKEWVLNAVRQAVSDSTSR